MVDDLVDDLVVDVLVGVVVVADLVVDVLVDVGEVDEPRRGICPKYSRKMPRMQCD